MDVNREMTLLHPLELCEKGAVLESFAGFGGFLFSLCFFLLLVGFGCRLLHLFLFFVCHDTPLLIALNVSSMSFHGLVLLYQI